LGLHTFNFMNHGSSFLTGLSGVGSVVPQR
jgi:hypothetical protein